MILFSIYTPVETDNGSVSDGIIRQKWEWKNWYKRQNASMSYMIHCLCLLQKRRLWVCWKITVMKITGRWYRKQQRFVFHTDTVFNGSGNDDVIWKEWLCTRMSYHIFPNLGELIQGDLVNNIRWNLASTNFLDRECNCNTTTKVKVRCVYGGECRKCYVIYKVMCKFCGEFYVGNNQNTL